MSSAQILLPSARSLLTDDFRSGASMPDLTDYLTPSSIDHPLDLEMLRTVVDSAMRKFDANPVESDRWLAPRLHATLRLRRKDAAEVGIWRWLAAVILPDYVRWRFPAAPIKRFTGGDRDNAVSRLWWGAELFRNGSDYAPVVRAFSMQDIPNTWLILNAMHNRAAAQAALTYLPEMTSDTINRLSSALDHVLMTIQLDAVAPVDPPDTVALEEWVAASPDVDDLIDDKLPEGPLEDPVDEEHVAAVKVLIERVATAIGLELP